MDFLSMFLGRALDALVMVGTAVEVLIYFVPIVLGVLVFIMVLNYRDDLRYKRIVYSRINEIDELSLAKFKLFIPTLLQLIGYVPVFEDEADDQLDENFAQKKVEDAVKEVARETAKGAEDSSVQEDEPAAEQAEYSRENTGEMNQVEEQNKQQSPAKISPDALVKKDGKKCAVMVEKKDSGISPRIFNRLEKAMGDHDCDHGILINNGSFSEEELEQGELRFIEMWDRDRIIKELLRLQGKEDTKGQPFLFYVKDFFRWIVRG